MSGAVRMLTGPRPGRRSHRSPSLRACRPAMWNAMSTASWIASGRLRARASWMSTSARSASTLVEGLARVTDLDPDVPPFVAREQVAQLAPSDLEVVDQNRWPLLVGDRVDLPA